MTPVFKQHLWDVVAVNIKTGMTRVMDRDMTEPNAEAYIRFAVMRRGVDTEFFKAVPAGSIQGEVSDA